MCAAGYDRRALAGELQGCGCSDLLGFDAQGGGRWWFQEVHGFGRMLATIGLLGFDALGVHFACVVELGDVEPSLGSMHGLFA